MTHFSITIGSRDGRYRKTLTATHDLVVVPQIGTSVGLDTNYGVTAEVTSVYTYPTCDPAVYVTCRTLLYDTEEEAREVLEAALGLGWKNY